MSLFKAFKLILTFQVSLRHFFVPLFSKPFQANFHFISKWFLDTSLCPLLKAFFQANFHLLSKWFLDTSLCPLSKLFKLIFNHFPKWFSNTYQCPFSSFSASFFKCLKRFVFFKDPKLSAPFLKGFKIKEFTLFNTIWAFHSSTSWGTHCSVHFQSCPCFSA